MSPALSRLRLFAAMLCALLLSTSCGSLKSVRGDDIYYSDSDSKGKKDKGGKDKGGKGKGGKGKGDSGPSAPFSIPGDLDESTLALIREAVSWIGTPYVYGGESKAGADCSGFVMMTFKNALGIKLPRTSADQGKFCEEVDRRKLEVGDLVFFRTGSSDRINHVGIYVGDGKFIHASSSKGVMVSDLSLKYYADRYHHGGKVAQLRKMRGKKR